MRKWGHPVANFAKRAQVSGDTLSQKLASRVQASEEKVGDTRPCEWGLPVEELREMRPSEQQERLTI
jgi:hypothetical protein